MSGVPHGISCAKSRGGAVDAVLGDELADRAIGLVALGGAELVGRHFVVFDDGLVVARQPLHRLLFGAILVLVDEDRTRR